MTRKQAIFLFGSTVVQTAEHLYNEDGYESLFTSKEQTNKENVQWDYVRIAQSVLGVSPQVKG